MLNVAVLMGRLTADPELRHTPNNIAVTRFTVAVDRIARAGAERQADFITVVAWRQTAEFVCKYFKKGQMIAVDGSIQTGSYTDNNGSKRYTFEVVANNVSFTGSKENAGGGSNNYNNNNYENNYNNYNNNNNQHSTSQYQQPAPSYSSGSNEDFETITGDDDLPF